MESGEGICGGELCDETCCGCESCGDDAGSGGFREAVESFYRDSAEMTDEAILAAAAAIRPDGSALYEKLPPGDAGRAMEALGAYEEAKAAYLMDRLGGRADCGERSGDVSRKSLSSGDAGGAKEAAVSREEAEAACCMGGDGCGGWSADVVSEWEKQASYAERMIAEGSTVRSVIPRFQVSSVLELLPAQDAGAAPAEGDRALPEPVGPGPQDIGGAPAGENGALPESGSRDMQDAAGTSGEGTGTNAVGIRVEEWMALGYGEPDGSGPVNASAYSYSFSLILERDVEGGWTVASAGDTDENFAWLGEGDGEPDYEALAVRPGEEDGAVVSAALASGGDARMIEVSHHHYAYSASKAASYADKYWKHYNHSYVEYRGVDCANFVSQCLYAGGMPKTGVWFPKSVAWINVMAHIRHFKGYGMFLTASDYNVAKGNPVYYDWNGNGTYDHTAICVGRNSSGMPVVDAHTNNVFHVPWRMGGGGRRGTISLFGNGSSGSSAKKKNSWEYSSGKVYYIGPDGKRVKNRFMTINGKRYYFKSSGARASKFFKVGSKWYYASAKDGRLLSRWQNIGGKIYFFKSDYSRISPGIRTINGATYCFSSDGYRLTGFIKYKSKWYYGDRTTGKLAKGWKKIGGKWYYFDKKTFVRAAGYKTINGERCYFNSNGVLVSGKRR